MQSIEPSQQFSNSTAITEENHFCASLCENPSETSGKRRGRNRKKKPPEILAQPLEGVYFFNDIENSFIRVYFSVVMNVIVPCLSSTRENLFTETATSHRASPAFSSASSSSSFLPAKPFPNIHFHTFWKCFFQVKIFLLARPQTKEVTSKRYHFL